jgi:hypothetical protein
MTFKEGQLVRLFGGVGDKGKYDREVAMVREYPRKGSWMTVHGTSINGMKWRKGGASAAKATYNGYEYVWRTNLLRFLNLQNHLKIHIFRFVGPYEETDGTTCYFSNMEDHLKIHIFRFLGSPGEPATDGTSVLLGVMDSARISAQLSRVCCSWKLLH